MHNNKKKLNMWYVIAGASHNTDIGPDSEAQISNPNDEVDEKTHEQYHPDEHTIEGAADEKQTAGQKELNGKHENGKDHKTNTSVWSLSFKFDDNLLMKPCSLHNI